jgi:putative restriction endonuclease
MDFSALTLGSRYTRPELARLWGYESHHALSRGVITPRGQNVIVLFVTRIKQASLTPYDDFVSGELLFWEGEEKHGSDDRVANADRNGDEIHLFYREIHHAPFEYRGRVRPLSFVRETDRPSRFVFRLEHDLGPADDLERCRAQVDALPTETERQEVRKARIGQGRFRQQLMEMWGGQCSVTGVRLPPVLTAAHIKPWRTATNPERLDPHNGLLLLPQYDRLFDRGYITFDPDGRVLLSEALPAESVPALGVRAGDRLRFVGDRHRPFFEYHRQTVFIAPETDGAGETVPA